ncbi:MAG: EAL domain-containing protein [Rhodospirillaceae bacterium]
MTDSADSLDISDARGDNDILVMIEDDEETSAAADSQSDQRTNGLVWHLLVVDDDLEVHASTAFALSGVEILGRRLELLHAQSGAEALDILRENGREIAVVLLDVVMETDDAGLATVRTIREELGLVNLRIILRTGQPGYAPELEVLRDYDINDYRTKSELTEIRLLSSLYTALKSFIHLKTLDANRRTLEASREGLKKIIDASADLFARRSITAFCEGILTQVGGLLDIEASGIVLVRQRCATAREHDSGPVVLAASGLFSHLAGASLSRIPDEHLKKLLERSLEEKRNVFNKLATVLHIPGPFGDDVAVLISTSKGVTELDRRLLEIFCSNVTVGFDNIGLLEHVRNMAFIDPLTRLPNRTRFQIEISERLERMRASGSAERLFVLLLDIDHFQMINDGLGHAVGDEVLRKVATELCRAFNQAGAVSRMSGDRYGILSPVSCREDEAGLLDMIAMCFAQPFEIDGNTMNLAVSGGYSILKPSETDVPTAIRCAGIALKRAKRQGRGQIIRYTGTMAEELKTRLTLINQLSEAITNRQLMLHYQPQLSLRDGGVMGVEALLRWQRPDGSFIRPDIFIPAAEDSGHILPLGDWVLRQAFLKQVYWRQCGLGHLSIAVNVSVRQLRERGFAQTVEGILHACGADPAAIELEITESTAMESNRIVSSVNALRGLGFRIAIDDFGTGYSSLSRLRQLPVTMLKIDRSFVDKIDTRPDSRSIAAMIVKMGHELGFSTLAEGVETVAQEAVLRDLGCDYVQGFLYAKAMPADDLPKWLNHRAAVAA